MNLSQSHYIRFAVFAKAPYSLQSPCLGSNITARNEVFEMVEGRLPDESSVSRVMFPLCSRAVRDFACARRWPSAFAGAEGFAESKYTGQARAGQTLDPTPRRHGATPICKVCWLHDRQ